MSFECRHEGNEGTSLTDIWAKSISGRGNSNYRGAVVGAGLAGLNREDSDTGTQGTRDASERIWGVGRVYRFWGPYGSEFVEFDSKSCQKQVECGQIGAVLEHV